MQRSCTLIFMAVLHLLIGAIDAGFRTLVRSWILKSSDAVSHYYEKFPVPRVTIKVLVIDGNGVGNGVTIPGNIPKITIHVGDLASEATLMQSDWVMVHEMIHLAFPWMTAKYN